MALDSQNQIDLDGLSKEQLVGIIRALETSKRATQEMMSDTIIAVRAKPKRAVEFLGSTVRLLTDFDKATMRAIERFTTEEGTSYDRT